METVFFTSALAAYMTACVIGVVFLLNRSGRLFSISSLAATAAFSALTIYMALRWHEAGRAPLSNMYESLVFFSWAIWLVAFMLRLSKRSKETAVLSIFIAAVCLGYASTMDSSIRPLMPALQSDWLFIHVFVIFLGYAGLAAAFAAGLGLWTSILLKKDAAAWERASVLCMRFGFIFLTYGILTGSVWANEAWGAYWGWDPKEIWALVTWIFYLLFFILTGAKRESGKFKEGTSATTAFFSIAGFAVVLFTYFGVSYLLHGLHSYR